MKRLLIILCCLVSFAGSAQAPPVIYSEPFEEPEGYDDIILTKDGRTVMLYLTNKSLVMDFYDNAHKLAHHFENTEEVWDKGAYRDRYIRGNFMIGGQFVVFLQGNHKNENPTLHRIIISPETGKIVSSEVTAIIPPEARSQRRAAKYVDDGQMYSVKKDPNSDAYAVASYFIQDLDGAALPYVIHYDGQHKELGRNVIKSPRFAFSYYEDMMVLGTDEVWVATTPFNNGKGNRESSGVMLTRLKGNDTSSALVHNWSSSWKPASAWLAYNAKEQTIQMMTRVLMSSQSAAAVGPKSNTIINTYAANIIALDRQAGTFRYGKSLNYSLVTKSRNLNYDIAAPYVGLPKEMQVKDGILTVISEEDSKLPSHDIGIVDYDTSGSPIAGFAVRKGTASGARSGVGWASAGFYDFEHFNTPSGRYVFFNDHPANFERDAEKTPKYLTGVGDAHTVCYRLADKGLSKFYLFGTPDKSFDNRFADFSTDDYNEASAEYAVLIIEKNGRNKHARIAWVQMKNTP